MGVELTTRSKLFWAILYSAAMAYLESVVVVYLRNLYYPQGFEFPIIIASLNQIMAIEIGREAATIIMLVAIGFFCGRTRLERFAYLMLAFGFWDIMYYVWLKVFVNWPESLLTWDLLFLIPIPWVGPVLAPVLVSMALIGAGLWIISRVEKGITIKMPQWVWWAEIAAGMIIIISFILDMKTVTTGGLPHPFRWEVFLIGLAGGLGIFTWQAKRNHYLKDETGLSTELHE